MHIEGIPMSDLTYRPNRVIWLVVAIIAVAARPALAQDDGWTSAFEMFFWPGNRLGLIVTWLLIALSLVSVSLTIYHVLLNRAAMILPDDAVEAVEQLIRERDFRGAIDLTAEDDSVFGQTMHAALGEASNGYGAMERAVEETSDLLAARRVRKLELLNVLGAVGPMIGLFGTVYGMIVTFQSIVETAGTAKPDELAAGISTALVTTFWGLIVGIPAIAAYALIRTRIDAQVAEAVVVIDGLIGRFRPSSRRSSSGGGGEGESAQPKPAE